MTRRQFYERLGQTLNKRRGEIADIAASIRDIDDKILHDKTLTTEYKRNTLTPRASLLRAALEKAKHNATEECKRITAEYRQELEEEDARLDAQELNDDTKFLSMGVKLDADMLRTLIRRNDGNATMTKLLFRYAENNGYKPRELGMTYTSKAEQINPILDTVEYSAEKVIRWADHPDMDLFDRMLGPGTYAAQALNVYEDGSKAPEITF